MIDKENHKIHSANAEYKWPSVIRLNEYQKIPYKRIILNRKNVFKRDQHKCAYCGRGDLQLTVDHIVPRAMGGQDTWENLVTACLPCNNKKGNYQLSETKLKLRTHPYKPNYISFIKNIAGRIDTRWKPFLFLN